jgi:hypothetical protein
MAPLTLHHDARSQRLIDVGVAAFLSLAVWLLYHDVLRLWWTYDDGYHLHTAVTYSVWQYFFDPVVGRSIVSHLFTPLLQASYDVELSIFGLAPARFYVVHLIEIAAAAILIHAAARLWLTWPFAAAAALIFVSGVPFVSVATELMVMHYVQSVALAGAAMLAFVLALRSSRSLLLVVSSIAYLCAMLAKEIAVPLPLLLCLLPVRDLRTRMRALTPHAAALAIYVLWRWIMLGTLFGGYGWAITDVGSLVASLPNKIATAFMGRNRAAGTAALVVMAVGAIYALRSRRAVALVIIGFVVSVAPIVPMTPHMEERLAIGPWLWWCATFAAGCAAIRRPFGEVIVLIAVVCVVIANRQQWRPEFASNVRMSQEGRGFLALGSDALLRDPAIPPAAMGEVRWMKEEHLHLVRGAGWFNDDLFLCIGGAEGKRVWQYNRAVHAIVDISPHVRQMTREYCEELRQNAPLEAQFHYRGGTLAWQLGPYREGEWRLVMGIGTQAYDVSASDAFRLPDVPGLKLRVRYESPQHWVTYSPEINLDFVKRPDLEWHR